MYLLSLLFSSISRKDSCCSLRYSIKNVSKWVKYMQTEVGDVDEQSPYCQIAEYMNSSISSIRGAQHLRKPVYCKRISFLPAPEEALPLHHLHPSLFRKA